MEQGEADAVAGAAEEAPSLADLPLEVLENICGDLDLRSRVCLASCCRALWERADLAASPAVWGELGLTWPAREVPARQRSLAAWLLPRRACALRELSVVVLFSASGGAAGLEDLLRSLAACSRLACVELSFETVWDSTPGVEAAAALALEQLGELSSLTSLVLLRPPLRRLPEWLGLLGTLAQLRIQSAGRLGEGLTNSSLASLAGCRALTCLEIWDCGLRSCPPALASLTQLRSLDLSDNEWLGQGLGEGWTGLQRLSALSSLALSYAGMRALPPHLGQLPRLQRLLLFYNPSLGASSDSDTALAPLAGCSALTLLDLGCCGLSTVPAALQPLGGALRALRLSGNKRLGAAEAAAFAPLLSLTRLSSLLLGNCSLRRVPQQLSALTALAQLELSYNPALAEGGPGAYMPLVHLARCGGALVRVELTGLPLDYLPCSVRALASEEG